MLGCDSDSEGKHPDDTFILMNQPLEHAIVVLSLPFLLLDWVILIEKSWLYGSVLSAI